MVDTVLYFEGERGRPRFQRVKTASAPRDEIGVFEMTGVLTGRG
jgi:predicted ATP-dependent serine protease